MLLAGAALLLAAALAGWRHFGAAAPYRYVAGAALPASGAMPARQQVQLLATETGQVLAQAEVASSPQGPVLVAWQAQVDDPLLYLPIDAQETLAVADVIARHRAADEPVLSWWDNARQMRLFGAGAMRFDAVLDLPLFVPPRWQGQRELIAQVESAYWGAPAAPALASDFKAFAAALASEEAEGVQQLQALVQGRKAVLVLHLRDLIPLGQLEPRRIGVAFRDFADEGDVHRSVRGVHGWLREQGHAAYGVMPLPQNRVRAIAVTDEAGAKTLAARLLPLSGNRQDDVAGLTLVYRHGGYVVYELQAASPPGKR